MISKKLIYFLIYIAITLIFGIITIFTKSFALDVIFHILIKSLIIPGFAIVLNKAFKDFLPHSMKKVIVLCGAVVAVDLIVLDAVKYVISGGESIVLFLPACVPICFMIMMLYSHKDKQREKGEKALIFAVGIPLLLLALSFEIISFMNL